MPRNLTPRPLKLTARTEVPKATDPKAVRTFRMVANTGEPMNIFPYDLPVVVDLDTLDVSGLPVPALYDHCPHGIDYIVGLVEAAAVENGSFVASGKFTPTDEPDDKSRKVLAKADAGHVWQVSIGGDPKVVEEVKAGTSAQVNGRTYAGPVAVARGVVLREISFVVLGGDRRTSAVVARHRPVKGTSAMTFEQFCLSKGFDPAALDEVQRANLELDFATAYPEGASDVAAEDLPTDDEIAAMDDPADVEEEIAAVDDLVEEGEELPTNAAAVKVKLQARLKKLKKAARIAARRNPAPAPRPTPRPVRASADQVVAAERARVKEIARLCSEHGDPRIRAAGGTKVKLMAHAVSEGWTTDQVKTELLKVKRSDRPTGPNVIVKSHDKDCSLQALQGAYILRAGGKIDHKAYQSPKAMFLQIPAWLRAGINDASRNRIMEAAHKYSDLSAVDLCREACRLDGKNPGHGRSETIQAAFSGSSLTNIFTTNVNAILLTSYMEAPDTTVGWVTEAEVADFKTQERPRVEVGPGLAKLPRGGEADDASYEDNAESYKIARYAKKFTVDEQDIIDDSLGALSDIPNKFGQAAARLRPDLVYAILLGNPTLAATARALFNTTDANLGNTSALAAPTLKVAIAAMQNIRENDVNLNLTASHLIVPPALRFTAKELVSSAEIIVARGGTTDLTVERGSRNVLTDENLTIVSDSRLENGVTDPASGTTHSGSATTWFLASVMAHLIEVGYLRGTGRAPRVRSGTLDKGSYGMWWDVSMDIGAKALDWKGLRKTTA